MGESKFIELLQRVMGVVLTKSSIIEFKTVTTYHINQNDKKDEFKSALQFPETFEYVLWVQVVVPKAAKMGRSV